MRVSATKAELLHRLRADRYALGQAIAAIDAEAEALGKTRPERAAGLRRAAQILRAKP